MQIISHKWNITQNDAQIFLYFANHTWLGKVLFVQPNIIQAHEKEYHQIDQLSQIALWMRVGSVVCSGFLNSYLHKYIFKTAVHTVYLTKALFLHEHVVDFSYASSQFGITTTGNRKFKCSSGEFLTPYCLLMNSIYIPIVHLWDKNLIWWMFHTR